MRLVSFVIPAHNERVLIGAAVDAVHGAAREAGVAYEVIVTDDASTDETAKIAAEHGARVVASGCRQIAGARNAGAAAARGDVLIFVDADTLVTTGAVREALRAIEGGAVGGGGPVRFDGPVPFYARVLLAVTLIAFRLAGLTGGCFLFCTRRAFDAAGGWDETMYAGEEIELAGALKQLGRFVIVRTPVVTSGRKLRTHSAREVFRPLWGVALRGRGAVRSREGLELWYERREG